MANKLATNTAIFIASNQMWHEMKNIILVTALLAVYLLLLVPYIVFTKANNIYQHWAPYNLELYRNLSSSYYEDDSYNSTTSTTLPPLIRARSFGFDTKSNLTLHDPGLWEVPEIKDGITDAETVFVWMRFIHFALMPIVILILNKDIRQKAGDLLICCGRSRSSSITPRPISALLHRQNMEFNKKHHQKKFKLCDYHVPVLFATQEGLYLRILDNELATPSQDSQEIEVNKNMWTIEPQFITEICDLKIEGQSFVSHYSNSSTAGEGKHEEDEGFHDNNSNHELVPNHEKKKPKKSVHFRNTVIEISKELNGSDSGNSHTSEHREYRDVRERKMTGLGERRHHHDHHEHHHHHHHHHHEHHGEGGHSHSAKSHRKHRRPSFNPDGHHADHHHHRRNSVPL